MNTSHTIIIFNPICIFKFAFKHTLMSLNFFSCVVKDHIVELIDFILVKIRFNVFMCFVLSTIFFTFVQEDFIH